MYVPWVYHLAAKQGCTDVRVWLPKLGGLNIFCAHILRGCLWASPIFIFFFLVCVDVGNRTNVTSLTRFFVQEHILAKFGALRARNFNSRDRSLSLRNRYRSLHGRACMCWFGSALCTIYRPSCWNISRACPLYHLLSVVLEHAWLSPAPRQVCPESKAWLKTAPPSLPEDP